MFALDYLFAESVGCCRLCPISVPLPGMSEKRRQALWPCSASLSAGFLRFLPRQSDTSEAPLAFLSFNHNGGRDFQSPWWDQERDYHRWAASLSADLLFEGIWHVLFSFSSLFFFFFLNKSQGSRNVWKIAHIQRKMRLKVFLVKMLVWLKKGLDGIPHRADTELVL